MKLIQHHVKYKEIHGIDEIVMMTSSDHKNLHNRLRKEGKCNIPGKVLRKIASAASTRTIKHKKYMKENIERFYFSSSLGLYVSLIEQIYYNKNNGNVYYSDSLRFR